VEMQQRIREQLFESIPSTGSIHVSGGRRDASPGADLDSERTLGRREEIL